jgi:type II secretory pathway component PulF
MTQLAEPALVVILGVVIGTLVVAMYLPIFSMGDLFT